MINRITDNQFKLVSKYQPSGDQPQAIEQLVDNIAVSYTHLTLPTILLV